MRGQRIPDGIPRGAVHIQTVSIDLSTSPADALASARCLACGGELGSEPAVVGRDRLHSIRGTWSVYECRECGSGTTLPLALESELGTFYPTDYAPYRATGGLVGMALEAMQRARNRRFPLRELDAGHAGTLLDVGCGGGELAASWLHRGWRALGIEPSPQAAAVARARGVEIVGATLTDATLEARSLDAVVFRHSLEHVVDPVRDLHRVHTALRPGGRLAVTVPNWSSWQRRLFADRWFPLELPRHRTHFTSAGLEAALRAAGFDELRIRPATPFITTTWSVQYWLFDRVVTGSEAMLLLGYACAAPVAVVSSVLDRLLGGGDFLEAAAVRGPDLSQ